MPACPPAVVTLAKVSFAVLAAAGDIVTEDGGGSPSLQRALRIHSMSSGHSPACVTQLAVPALVLIDGLLDTESKEPVMLPVAGAAGDGAGQLGLSGVLERRGRRGLLELQRLLVHRGCWSGGGRGLLACGGRGRGRGRVLGLDGGDGSDGAASASAAGACAATASSGLM
jgi:hypothetical protein